MKRFGEVRKLIALLSRREEVLRRQVQRELAELSKVVERIDGERREIERLREALAVAGAGRSYAQPELMRWRGEQAAKRFEIARRRAEECELHDARSSIEGALAKSRFEILALEQRLCKHRNWTTAQSFKRKLLQEYLDQADVLVGRASHAIKQH
ncbi:hypothetical protein PHO31112_03936 [Pandoraea horticolens]|uniref:Uncharacterized protein n=1 Tax=Pandoraea horticolens TaxID=2508298 RepID=A0A5E4XKV7_9BURK|nr:hypothetical protein [Pandoraea horticolens]VVE36926.1 hypothetical protein PHO31112_03936 [Pandoraea horticolens]